jgi:hypothetical protein
VKCSCGADEDSGLGVSSSGMKKMDGEDEGGAADLDALAFAFVGGLGDVVGGRCRHCVRLLLVGGCTWDRESLDPCLLASER